MGKFFATFFAKLFWALGIILSALVGRIARPLAWHLILWRHRATIRSVAAIPGQSRIPRPEDGALRHTSKTIGVLLLAGCIFAVALVQLDLPHEVGQQLQNGAVSPAAAAFEVGLLLAVMVAIIAIMTFGGLVLRWTPTPLKWIEPGPDTVLTAKEVAPVSTTGERFDTP